MTDEIRGSGPSTVPLNVSDPGTAATCDPSQTSGQSELPASEGQSGYISPQESSPTILADPLSTPQYTSIYSHPIRPETIEAWINSFDPFNGMFMYELREARPEIWDYITHEYFPSEASVEFLRDVHYGLGGGRFNVLEFGHSITLDPNEINIIAVGGEFCVVEPDVNGQIRIKAGNIGGGRVISPQHTLNTLTMVERTINFQFVDGMVVASNTGGEPRPNLFRSDVCEVYTWGIGGAMAEHHLLSGEPIFPPPGGGIKKIVANVGLDSWVIEYQNDTVVRIYEQGALQCNADCPLTVGEDGLVRFTPENRVPPYEAPVSADVGRASTIAPGSVGSLDTIAPDALPPEGRRVNVVATPPAEHFQQMSQAVDRWVSGRDFSPQTIGETYGSTEVVLRDGLFNGYMESIQRCYIEGMPPIVLTGEPNANGGSLGVHIVDGPSRTNLFWLHHDGAVFKKAVDGNVYEFIRENGTFRVERYPVGESAAVAGETATPLTVRTSTPIAHDSVAMGRTAILPGELPPTSEGVSSSRTSAAECSSRPDSTYRPHHGLADPSLQAVSPEMGETGLPSARTSTTPPTGRGGPYYRPDSGWDQFAAQAAARAQAELQSGSSVSVVRMGVDCTHWEGEIPEGGSQRVQMGISNNTYEFARINGEFKAARVVNGLAQRFQPLDTYGFGSYQVSRSGSRLIIDDSRVSTTSTSGVTEYSVGQEIPVADAPSAVRVEGRVYRVQGDSRVTLIQPGGGTRPYTVTSDVPTVDIDGKQVRRTSGGIVFETPGSGQTTPTGRAEYAGLPPVEELAVSWREVASFISKSRIGNAFRAIGKVFSGLKAFGAGLAVMTPLSHILSSEGVIQIPVVGPMSGMGVFYAGHVPMFAISHGLTLPEAFTSSASLIEFWRMAGRFNVLAHSVHDGLSSAGFDRSVLPDAWYGGVAYEAVNIGALMTADITVTSTAKTFGGFLEGLGVTGARTAAATALELVSVYGWVLFGIQVLSEMQSLITPDAIGQEETIRVAYYLQGLGDCSVDGSDDSVRPCFNDYWEAREYVNNVWEDFGRNGPQRIEEAKEAVHANMNEEAKQRADSLKDAFVAMMVQRLALETYDYDGSTPTQSVDESMQSILQDILTAGLPQKPTKPEYPTICNGIDDDCDSNFDDQTDYDALPDYEYAMSVYESDMVYYEANYDRMHNNYETLTSILQDEDNQGKNLGEIRDVFASETNLSGCEANSQFNEALNLLMHDELNMLAAAETPFGGEEILPEFGVVMDEYNSNNATAQEGAYAVSGLIMNDEVGNTSLAQASVKLDTQREQERQTFVNQQIAYFMDPLGMNLFGNNPLGINSLFYTV